MGTTGLRATTILASALSVPLLQTIPTVARTVASNRVRRGAGLLDRVEQSRRPRWALLVAAAASYSYYTNATKSSQHDRSRGPPPRRHDGDAPPRTAAAPRRRTR